MRTAIRAFGWRARSYSNHHSKASIWLTVGTHGVYPTGYERASQRCIGTKLRQLTAQPFHHRRPHGLQNAPRGGHFIWLFRLMVHLM